MFGGKENDLRFDWSQFKKWEDTQHRYYYTKDYVVAVSFANKMPELEAQGYKEITKQFHDNINSSK